MDPAPLIRESAGGVVRLRLNRPGQLNALSDALLAALAGELAAFAADPDLRCVVLSGEGKAFCAGHDLREMRGRPAIEDQRALFARCSAVMQAIRALPVPVIAQVHGIATAAGCQLVAACDLALAARSARFAVSGVNLGLFCSTPAVALSRAVAPKRAFEMLVTGRFIDAATALEWGLINQAVDDADLAEAVAQLAATISAKSPAAIRHGKALFHRQLPMRLEDAYAAAGETMACNMMEPDAQAGIDAFLDKRTPR